MAFIKITELRLAGSELFQDSETFLNELSVQEMGIVGGGDYDDGNIYIGQITKSVGISLVESKVKSVFSFAGKKKFW
jgi:hypothetical protein